MTDPTTTMTDADRGQVNATAAEIYDDFFVPALFGQFTDPVLHHAGVAEGERVLDVGCGTGILARAARAQVGANGHVAGIDPNEGMLSVARRAQTSVDWRTGTAESLPFDAGAFDRTICQFSAMFFRDRATALDEMARVTRTGGSVTTVTWSSLDQTTGYAAMVSLIADELGPEAANALRAPFVLGEHEQIRAMVSRIGTDLRIDEIQGTARFSSIADWVHTDVRGWTLADLVDDAGEARLTRRAERDLAGFVSPDGTVAFPAPAIVATVSVEP